MSHAVRSSFEDCFTSPISGFVSKANFFLGWFDDAIFKFGEHTSWLGRHISKLSDNSEAEHACERTANVFATARDAIGSIRFISSCFSFFSGEMFVQTTSKGYRRVLHENGKPIRISRKDFFSNWKKKNDKWVHRTHKKWKSSDGIYIDHKKKGSYVLKDFLDIIMGILVFLGRLLSPILLLDRLKAIDLGKHVEWMRGLALGIWTAVGTLGCVLAVRDLNSMRDYHELGKKIWDVFQAFLDWITSLLEAGVSSSAPGFGIAISCMHIISALSSGVKEIFYL